MQLAFFVMLAPNHFMHANTIYSIWREKFVNTYGVPSMVLPAIHSGKIRLRGAIC